MLRGTFLTLALAATAATAFAQPRTQPNTDCRDRVYSGGRERAVYCENREETFAGSGLLDVDASRNGGIRVRGWDRTDIRVIAQVTAYAESESRARALAEAVRVETGARIRATGPDTGRNESWNVSYQIDVPRDARLALNTNNGGITIEDFRGTATFRATNGGVSLTDVSGDLRGATTNGGVEIRLIGDRWEGPGLDVETRNGGVRMLVPERYSAELETSTVNGRVRIDFPVTVTGTLGSNIKTTLGSGGARVRAVTRNGGIRIERR
jgi:DUF4097 and DUF4098 domain-containing protein YvlB